MRFSSLFGFLAAGSAIALTSSSANAQVLADLQPGRNFSSSANFGLGRSENLDPGDVDNDGDMDVGVANGGDGAAQANRIYINNGGLQGGTIGTFTDGTATRFAGVTVDTSRDIEFVDFDNDADLDVYIGNRGTTANGGEVSRFYVNKGGLQAGTIGFFQEDTALRWGTLASVPVGDQVFGGNAGPWRDYTCDCDFGDLDDDGDTDLFHSGYGPAIDGTRNSRIFLNTGAGIFNEIFPWANASADIKTHTIDFDLVDLDGDFDLDVSMASRNSQARQYNNNLYNPISASMFNDTTQWSLLTNQAGGSASVNYENEYGDVDGDGDFDIWLKNYNGNLDRIFRNDGFTAGMGSKFTQMNGWIKGDPNVDENEIDFIDYDGDGDLDAYLANFSGTNFLYQNGLAQGLNYDVVGLYHRTGLASGLSPNHELSAANNGGTSLDGDIVDVDNDGDDDIILANDGDQQNWLFTNILGVPDTHAPTFYKVTNQADKANGTSTVIHAALRDNTSYYLTNFYPTNLVYRVNGGAEVTVQMFHQGSMQFRGVIPAQTDKTITYHVTTEDLAGNSSTSAEVCFKQGAPADPWTNIGSALGGVSGFPLLQGTGTLVGGCPMVIALSNAKGSAASVLFVSVGLVPGAAFKGGFLATVPFILSLNLPTSPSGQIVIPASMPFGANGFALPMTLQYAIQDAAAINGVSLSNAIKGIIP
jgi:hypothetical protein